jgi:hypothetical protein
MAQQIAHGRYRASCIAPPPARSAGFAKPHACCDRHDVSARRERLGTPFALDFGNEGLLSPEAVADPPVFARARAVAHLEDGPVHRLKYNDRMELAKPLGAWIAHVGNDLLAEADLLMPVPLHRRRLAARRSGARLGASHRRPMRRPCRSFRPRAGQADAIPGRTFALATGSQFARRVSGDGRDGGANRRPRRGAYRRCHDLGGDRKRRFARTSARRRQARRCLGFRAGGIRFCFKPPWS